MALFIYGTATNTGKGFFTAEDRRNFFLRGYPANVWVVHKLHGMHRLMSTKL